ncbi:hypothetical protein Bbelb_069520 [Branchiostoma belcheri]|nr:hypothetical protein Bbelb_069520 [Branchiostoma belcheri]
MAFSVRTDMSDCVLMAFRNKEKSSYLCVDGWQHYIWKETGMFASVGMAFSNKDRHVFYVMMVFSTKDRHPSLIFPLAMHIAGSGRPVELDGEKLLEPRRQPTPTTIDWIQG